ncbi:MAG TPA: hypothetical protein VEK07_12035 [Polyangiaceae bacterium]|nr:hypothetical protein [Polyangiaceae bacterium]
MAIIQLTRTELVVRFRGWNALHALRRSLCIPLGHVRAVRTRPHEGHFDHAVIEGWRGIGTYAPGRLAVGLLHLRNGPSFLEVRDPKHTIAVDVEHERIWGYRVNHLVLQVERESPEAAAARIEHAIDRYMGRSLSGRITPPPPTPIPPPPDEELLPNGVAPIAIRL